MSDTDTKEERKPRMYRMDELEEWGLDKGFYQRRTRRSRELEDRDLESNIRYNGFYHRLFEGYREELVPREDGKRKQIVRVYIGDYYKRKCSNGQWLLVKAAYVLLYLAAAAVYLFALTRPAESNTVWYTAAPGLLSVIPMMLLFAKIMACMAAKRNMVIYDYKYVFQRVFLFCAIAAGFLCATALMMLLYLVLHPQADVGKELTPCLCCLLSAAMILGIGVMERRAEYESVENPNASPEDHAVT